MHKSAKIIRISLVFVCSVWCYYSISSEFAAPWWCWCVIIISSPGTLAISALQSRYDFCVVFLFVCVFLRVLHEGAGERKNLREKQSQKYPPSTSSRRHKQSWAVQSCMRAMCIAFHSWHGWNITRFPRIDNSNETSNCCNNVSCENANADQIFHLNSRW